MHDIRANILENRLYIMLDGKLDLDSYRLVSEQVIKQARRLVPGYAAITDIRGLAPAPEEVRLAIQETMQALQRLGIGPVIRIVSDGSVVTANQFQRTSRAVGYTAQHAATIGEAERALDQLQ
jgi:hypothetical protein